MRIAIHGHQFDVTSSNWADQDTVRDYAVETLENLLWVCSADAISAPHRQLKTNQDDNGAHTIAARFCARAVEKAAKGWDGGNVNTGLSGPSLTLSAA